MRVMGIYGALASFNRTVEKSERKIDCMHTVTSKIYEGRKQFSYHFSYLWNPTFFNVLDR